MSFVKISNVSVGDKTVLFEFSHLHGVWVIFQVLGMMLQEVLTRGIAHGPPQKSHLGSLEAHCSVHVLHLSLGSNGSTNIPIFLE